MGFSLTVDVVRAWVMNRVDAMRSQDSDRGDVPGWVIVTAIVVTLALAIGAIIVSKVTGKANTINLQ